MSSPWRHERIERDEKDESVEQEIAHRLPLVRLELRELFARGIEHTSDITAVNNNLVAADRSDLVIYAPAEMVDVKTVLDVISSGANGFDSMPKLDVGNNFFKSFYFRSPDGFSSILPEEIEGMRNGTYTPEPSLARPMQKPAIVRMLVDKELSEFTEDLIMKMSFGNPSYQKQRFVEELYMAHTFARKLVCETDPGVKNPDGTSDLRHLVK